MHSTAFWNGFEKRALFGFGKKKPSQTRIDRASEPPYDGDDLDWQEHIMHLEEKHGISIPDHVSEDYRMMRMKFNTGTSKFEPVFRGSVGYPK